MGFFIKKKLKNVIFIENRIKLGQSRIKKIYFFLSFVLAKLNFTVKKAL